MEREIPVLVFVGLYTVVVIGVVVTFIASAVFEFVLSKSVIIEFVVCKSIVSRSSEHISVGSMLMLASIFCVML